MDSLAKSDIFFVITTAVVIVVGIAAFIALMYAIRILRNVDDISKRVRDESLLIQEDIHAARAQIRKGSIIAGVVGFISSIFKRSNQKNKHHG